MKKAKPTYKIYKIEDWNKLLGITLSSRQIKIINSIESYSYEVGYQDARDRYRFREAKIVKMLRHEEQIRIGKEFKNWFNGAMAEDRE